MWEASALLEFRILWRRPLATARRFFSCRYLWDEGMATISIPKLIINDKASKTVIKPPPTSRKNRHHQLSPDNIIAQCRQIRTYITCRLCTSRCVGRWVRESSKPLYWSIYWNAFVNIDLFVWMCSLQYLYNTGFYLNQNIDLFQLRHCEKK